MELTQLKVLSEYLHPTRCQAGSGQHHNHCTESSQWHKNR
jgi:hypothetical protein